LDQEIELHFAREGWGNWSGHRADCLGGNIRCLNALLCLKTWPILCQFFDHAWLLPYFRWNKRIPYQLLQPGWLVVHETFARFSILGCSQKG
jgi:hypothetical protein